MAEFKRATRHTPTGQRASRLPAAWVQDDGGGHAHLRRVLNVMFPPAYIKLRHQPPHSVCSLFALRWTKTAKSYGAERGAHEHPEQQQAECEPSSEPSSRAQVIQLQNFMQESLAAHQAKPVGLCPIRRAIYDQCFDELIRQVTVGCVEQGLLLFRIRNELRMTLGYYRRAYESAVTYGLNKAVDASLRQAQSELERGNWAGAESADGVTSQGTSAKNKRDTKKSIEEENRLEELKMKDYYEDELAKKDEVIAQQRAIIKAISQRP